tara:strand:+ start:529 stop:918 length:390 start_codon:yes stop_codon:yes gene_type:complete
MATHTGSAGLVKVGTNTVAEVRSFTLDTTAELLEDTTLTDTSKSFQVGKKGATASVECFWDETDTNGQIALAEGNSVTLNLYPEGADSGDYYYTGTFLVTANSVSVPTDGIIESTFSATLTGALSRSTV